MALAKFSSPSTSVSSLVFRLNPHKSCGSNCRFLRTTTFLRGRPSGRGPPNKVFDCLSRIDFLFASLESKICVEDPLVDLKKTRLLYFDRCYFLLSWHSVRNTAWLNAPSVCPWSRGNVWNYPFSFFAPLIGRRLAK